MGRKWCVYRSTDTLKTQILDTLKRKKGEIVPLDALKKELQIKKSEARSFGNAMRGLQSENLIAMHIGVNLPTS